jgi:hypothetical protein
MASIVNRAATTASASADKPAIVTYVGKLIEHVFMTRPTRLADGTYTKREATGKVALVYRITPVLADGSVTTSGAIWLWLEQQRDKDAAPKLDPAQLRAFRDSFGILARDMDLLDAEGVEAKDWAARPVKATAVAAAPVAPKKGLAAKAAAEADGATSVDLDTAIGSELPF